MYIHRANLSLLNWWGENQEEFSTTVLRRHVLLGVPYMIEVRMAPSKYSYDAVSK